MFTMFNVWEIGGYQHASKHASVAETQPIRGIVASPCATQYAGGDANLWERHRFQQKGDHMYM